MFNIFQQQAYPFLAHSFKAKIFVFGIVEYVNW